MDRRSALDVLELIRPDANELRHPDFAEALAYLETDEKAREVFLRRQEQDRRVAEAMLDVPVPEDLKSRMLEELAKDPDTKPEYAETPPSKTIKSRRWVLSACVVIASCLIAAVGVWFFGEKPQTLLTLHELEAEVPFESEDVAKLPAFSGSFQPAKPDWLWSESRFAFSPAKGFAPDAHGSHRVAVYEFFFRDPQQRHPGELRGVMLVVPKSQLQELPESASFFDGDYVIHPAKPRVAIRTWTEGERVYISMVPIQHFEALRRVFADLPA